MRIYKLTSGILIENDGSFHKRETDWDDFINQEKIHTALTEELARESTVLNGKELIQNELLPPIGSQELWASGVTYKRSREARVTESVKAGGGTFYEKVYVSERPELFMKAPSYRVMGHGQKVRIRNDSQWNVPEPELTLMINARAEIVGYTIGNDMSSRDIEGENPLYLPQAKCYNGSAAIGPCLLVTGAPLSGETEIRLTILRGEPVFEGKISVDQINRSFENLVEYLFKELSFPWGCLLMTGTGIIPPDDFTLQSGDEIQIAIDTIGTLVNYVE